MPIVSSQIVRNHDRGNGSLSVHEEFTDHLGKIHEHRYHCPLDHDVDASLIANAVKVLASIIKSEKFEVRDAIESGKDPVLIILRHLTTLQKAKLALRALMRGEGKYVIKAAQYISGFTNNQIENHFTVAQRIRIRARQNYILNNQATIEADDSQREEI